MDKKKQMSDTMRLGVLLAIAGGFLDAYTYLCRGGVFACLLYTSDAADE